MKRTIIDRLLFRWLPYPPDYVARSACEAAPDCYVCPRDRCTGGLNGPNEPDVDKPRSQTYSRGIHGLTEEGTPIHFLVSLQGFNEHLSLKAAPDDPRPNADPLPPGLEPDRMRWSFLRYCRYRSR